MILIVKNQTFHNSTSKLARLPLNFNQLSAIRTNFRPHPIAKTHSYEHPEFEKYTFYDICAV